MFVKTSSNEGRAEMRKRLAKKHAQRMCSLEEIYPGDDRWIVLATLWDGQRVALTAEGLSFEHAERQLKGCLAWVQGNLIEEKYHRTIRKDAMGKRIRA